jgi:hypothetical protein
VLVDDQVSGEIGAAEDTEVRVGVVVYVDGG